MTTPLSPAEAGIVSDVRGTLVKARLFREAWWTISGDHPRRSDIVRALNLYSDFFSLLEPALWIAYTASLASLFDKGSDSIALSSVPGIESEPGYQALWNKGRLLYRYRSKLIAHRDKKLVEKNFTAGSGLTHDAVLWILETACQCFNAAALRLDVDPLPPLSCEADLLLLVDDLSRHFPKSRAQKPPDL